MNDDLVTIAIVPNAFEAALVRNQLTAAGLAVFIADQEAVAMAWHLGGALGGVKVQVAHADEALARRILEDRRADAAFAPDEESTAIATPETAQRLAQEQAEDEAEEQAPLSRREKNVGRAALCAVYGLVFWPLQLYTYWLLVKIVFSDQRLEGKPLRNAWILGLILCLVPGLIVASFFLPEGFFSGDPLRDMKRLPAMVGDWTGLDNDGITKLDMELYPNGKLVYKESGGEVFEATGTWAFEDRQFLFRFNRIKEGKRLQTKVIYSFWLARLEATKMVLDEDNDGKNLIHLVRP